MFFSNENDQSSETNFNENEKNGSKNELDQLKDSFLRLTADFENYKKRTAKEKINWISNCQADLIMDILPIIDDFDRAFSGYKKGVNKEIDNILQGFELIHKAFYKFLEEYKIKEINNFDSFDPELHEAIAQIESPNNKSGEIVDIVQKGFMLNDRVLRPAKVTVAK